jgi:hypothetical protein
VLRLPQLILASQQRESLLTSLQSSAYRRLLPPGPGSPALTEPPPQPSASQQQGQTLEQPPVAQRAIWLLQPQAMPAQQSPP